MQSKFPLPVQTGYFPIAGEHLYTVLHPAANPIAQILLIGPFASERHFSYFPWVRWASYLAQRGVEVLRYDYRGVGESTGAFEDMSFDTWLEDAQILAGWLERRSPGLPLLLHGLEVGALLAAKVFQNRTGDGLLLWSPPANANQTMRSLLQRWAILEQFHKFGADRKPLSAFIRDLEQGSIVEVEGYPWSEKLWRDSLRLGLPPNLEADQRPVRIVKLGKEAAPLVKAGSIIEEETKDLTWLFAENWKWMDGALTLMNGVAREEGA